MELKTDKYNLRRIEKNMIISALNHHEGNRTHAAKDLGIEVRTLRNKLHAYDLVGYLLILGSPVKLKKKAKKAKKGEKIKEINVNRYWAIWKTPTDYYYPQTYPPTPAIKGWWEVKSNDSISTLCGVIDADDIHDAKAQINFDWEEATDFEFRKMTSVDWKPGKRYKLESWMKERLYED